MSYLRFCNPPLEVYTLGKAYTECEPLLATTQKDEVGLVLVLDNQMITAIQPQSERGKLIEFRKSDKLAATSLNPEHQMIWVALVTLRARLFV